MQRLVENVIYINFDDVHFIFETKYLAFVCQALTGMFGKIYSKQSSTCLTLFMMVENVRDQVQLRIVQYLSGII